MKRQIEIGELAIYYDHVLDEHVVVLVVDKEDEQIVRFSGIQFFEGYTVLFEDNLIKEIERYELFVDDEEISKGLFVSSFL